jgi:hypothetical protein
MLKQLHRSGISHSPSRHAQPFVKYESLLEDRRVVLFKRKRSVPLISAVHLNDQAATRVFRRALYEHDKNADKLFRVNQTLKNMSAFAPFAFGAAFAATTLGVLLAWQPPIPAPTIAEAALGTLALPLVFQAARLLIAKLAFRRLLDRVGEKLAEKECP